MKELEKQLKALANRRRLMILKVLKKYHKTPVGEIAKEIKLSFKATSKHLGLLYSAGILEKEQVNLTVFYRLADSLPAGIRQVIDVL
jgi:DNA-binding transcriptional ArsR family regulator